ncbi:5948_t:CDS:2 [Paraglomus brasilianum]|uniref:5948_t:CDS:1 n=1 Tax=Paraglomus brasilianum TaxID=144538 RepID=A0A9N8VZ35_9GLOM|nr:5948_t:CDS:2 [Paraglomus brasilianum]
MAILVKPKLFQPHSVSGSNKRKGFGAPQLSGNPRTPHDDVLKKEEDAEEVLQYGGGKLWWR